MMTNLPVPTESNSSRFLEAFNKIERHLRQVTKLDKHIPFYHVIDEASRSSRAVSYFSTDLKEFADLRNAIVHEDTNGHVIAEPNDRATNEIEHIASTLLNPPKVIPLFCKDVSRLKTSDNVAEAVVFMFNQSFSQIPIYDDRKFFALLTTNTVARWLGACVGEDIFSLRETVIRTVLDYAEDQDNYCFLSKGATIFEALEKFHSYEKAGKRLEAILITENGKPTESPIGIITIWDLPQIYRLLEYHP